MIKNSSKIKVAILGLGKIGMGYDKNLSAQKYVITHARAAQLHKRFELVGGYDPNPTKRDEFYRQYKRPTFSSAAQLIRECNPEVVIIASPTMNHRESIEIAIQSEKVIAILCEKPLSERLEESLKIIKLCQQRRVKLFLNFFRRADPGILEVKRRIECGVIQGPLKAVVWYSKGLLHNGSHFVDLMTFWLGPIRRVSRIGSISNPRKTRSEPDCLFEFRLGSAVFLSAKEKNFTYCTVEIVAQNGRLQLDSAGTIFWQAVENHALFHGYRRLTLKPETIRTDMKLSQLNVIKQLDRALLGKPSPICIGTEALRAQKWIEKIIHHDS